MDVSYAHSISSNEEGYHIAFARLYEHLSQFCGISEECWNEIQSTFSVVSYKPNQIVFNQNKLSKYVYFCTEGLARMYYTRIDGCERNKTFIKPGSAFASLQFLSRKQQNSYSVAAITNCTFCVASIRRIEELRDENLEFETIFLMLMQIYIMEKNKREYSLLMFDAKTRYKEFLREFGEQANQITLTDIALYLGITNVSLSRIRNELNNQK